MDWPTLTELARIAPTAVICVSLIYFGWWLRGKEVDTLKQWIASVRNSSS